MCQQWLVKCGWASAADNPRREIVAVATRFLVVAKVSGGAARHQTQDTPRNSNTEPLFLLYRVSRPRLFTMQAPVVVMSRLRKTF